MQTVLLTLPIYNEEDVLESNTNKIFKHCQSLDYDIKLHIVTNGCTDNSVQIAKKLSLNRQIIHDDIGKAGRGNALKYSWKNSNCDILSYADIDLSTDINHFAELYDSIDKADIVIGSRYLDSSQSNRDLLRLVSSRVYNAIVQIAFNSAIKDSQCGFKAIQKKSFEKLHPFLENDAWFFDTELLLQAQKHKMKIKEIPVKWKENSNSKVKLFQISVDYLKNINELKKRL